MRKEEFIIIVPITMAFITFILVIEYFLKKKFNVSNEDYGVVNKFHMYIRIVLAVITILLILVVEKFILLAAGSAAIFFLMETFVSRRYKKEVKVWIIDLYFSVMCLSLFIINLVVILKY